MSLAERAPSGAASSASSNALDFYRHASCFGCRCARGRARSAKLRLGLRQDFASHALIVIESQRASRELSGIGKTSW
jgi:hypothetical protein